MTHPVIEAMARAAREDDPLGMSMLNDTDMRETMQAALRAALEAAGVGELDKPTRDSLPGAVPRAILNPLIRAAYGDGHDG